MLVWFYSRIDKITMSHNDFLKALKSSFYKITMAHRNFINSTVKPNIHLEVLIEARPLRDWSTLLLQLANNFFCL